MSNRNQIATTTPAGQAPATQASTQASTEPQRTVQPAVDVYETESSITLLADMPGVPRDQLEIHVEGDALLIQGEARPETPTDLEPVWAELRVPRYRRSFTLSRELDTSRIEANLKDGVLTLRIPKQAHAQPRRIQVSAA
jgi:HSP20 family protein